MASKRGIRRRNPHRRPAPNWKQCCGDKESYETWDEAQENMERLTFSKNYDGRPLNVYKCPRGKEHYHFGHVPGQNTHGRKEVRYHPSRQMAVTGVV
jgi:hypothetical protein